ncbi:MAG: hypothetical protein SFY80_15640 [Verrucomicrobiota bacterium]|nr:hypothetical protein [Verrucomicrobiota bacterium]
MASAFIFGDTGAVHYNVVSLTTSVISAPKGQPGRARCEIYYSHQVFRAIIQRLIWGELVTVKVSAKSTLMDHRWPLAPHLDLGMLQMGRVLIVIAVFIFGFSGYLLLNVIAHAHSKVRIGQIENQLNQIGVSESEKKQIILELQRVHANAIAFTEGLEYSVYLLVFSSFALGVAGSKITRQKKQIEMLQAKQ